MARILIMKNKVSRIGAVLVSCLLVFGLTRLYVASQTNDDTRKVRYMNTTPHGPVSINTVEPRDTESVLDASQIVAYRTPRQHDNPLLSSALQGTEIDGSLIADANGNLIITDEIRNFFDYFFSAIDEVGLEAASDEIRRYSADYLPPKAAGQAQEILAQYIEFKKASMALMNTPLDKSKPLDAGDYIAILRQSFDALKAVRKGLFSPEVDSVFFEYDDAYADYTLKSLAIRNNPNLSDEQKYQAIEGHRQQLPQALRTHEKRQLASVAKQEEINQAINSDIDDSQLYSALIDNGYDDNSAQKVLSYRQQQKQFDTDYKAYVSASSAWFEPENLDRPERVAALSVLRAKFFITQEAQTRASLKDMSRVE